MPDEVTLRDELKERFKTEAAFALWLDSHGIPSRFGNWQWGLFG